MARFRSVVFLLAALSLAGCALDPHRDTALSHEGQEALLAGDLKTAESRLTEALAVNPDNPHALTNLSTVYIKQARYDEAKPLCERVIAHEEDYQQAAASDDESKEMARLVQLARDDLATIEKEQAEEQALLALTPDNSAPVAAPLVREPAAAPAAAPVTTAPASTAAAASAAPAPLVTATAASPFHYRIQVGAFKSRLNAERLAQRMKERHATAMQGKEVRLAEAGGMVKVQIGPYSSFKEALEGCRAFGEKGLRCYPKGRD